MPDRSGNWLETQLAREMAQVKAPDRLWERIQAEQRSRRALPRTGWMLWPAIATVMLVASGDLLWQSVSAASVRVGRASESMTERTLLRSRAPQAIIMNVSCQRCHVEPGLY